MRRGGAAGDGVVWVVASVSSSPFKGEVRRGMGVPILVRRVLAPIPTLTLPLKGREFICLVRMFV